MGLLMTDQERRKYLKNILKAKKEIVKEIFKA